MPKVLQREYDPRLAFLLKRGGVPDILAQVYAGRQIESPDDIAPSVTRLPCHSRLKGSKEAAVRIADAIALGERILIVSDYDADGATGCAVAYRALKGFGADVDFLIPNRQEHGYGLTEEVSRLAAERKPALLITVDNGISSFEGIDLARTLGMDVVVTDHHLQGDGLPPANVIVNPNQAGCDFPSKNIAGVGVIWMTMRAVQDEMLRRGADSWNLPDLHALLPIVAIGTVADVVALDWVNRSLVKEGLMRLRAGVGAVGINALASVSGMHPATVTTTDIAFMLAPRINAAGRLQSMDIGVETLITDDPETAERNAKELSAINAERKQIETGMVDEALARLPEVDATGSSIALCDKDWHQGVIGIVAGRIKEKYWRPTVIFTNEADGNHKGSARSIPGLHMRDALDLVAKENPGLVLKFGGHAMAAGLTIRKGGMPLFKRAFETVTSRFLKKDDLDQTIWTDGELTPRDLTEDNAHAVETGIWGQGFPPPLYQNTFTVLDQTFMKDKATGLEKHSRLKLALGGKEYSAVFFGFTDAVKGNQIDAVYQPGLNRFRGETKLQLRLTHLE